MALIVGLIILTLLIAILLMLFADEKQLKTVKSANGKMTGYWNGAERRADVRVATTLKATYIVDKKTQQKKDTISKNISLGGILMQLYEKLYPSTLLLLDIFLLDGQSPVAAKGEVVWVKELSKLDEGGRRTFDAGIKFVSMNTKDKERLDRQIKGLIKKRHG
jgi:c-di-GMP-binding flagellar brake protein YcgR